MVELLWSVVRETSCLRRTISKERKAGKGKQLAERINYLKLQAHKWGMGQRITIVETVKGKWGDHILETSRGRKVKMMRRNCNKIVKGRSERRRAKSIK